MTNHENMIDDQSWKCCESPYKHLCVSPSILWIPNHINIIYHTFFNNPSRVIIQSQQYYHPISFFWRYSKVTLPNPFVKISPNCFAMLTFTNLISACEFLLETRSRQKHNTCFEEWILVEGYLPKTKASELINKRWC